ncbi:MAG: hypothetical protein AAFR93_14480, partial [Pseudomonadota bacterium]
LSHLRFMAERPSLRCQMGRFAAQDTKPRFARAQILDGTVRLLKGAKNPATGEAHPDLAPSANPQRSALR